MVAALGALLATLLFLVPACDDRAGIGCGDDVCALCCNAGECRGSDATCWEGGDEGGRLILFCDGPEDCGLGETCCAGLPGGSFAIVSQCDPIATCAALPSPQFLCHDDADCRPGERCAVSFLGLVTCQ